MKKVRPLLCLLAALSLPSQALSSAVGAGVWLDQFASSNIFSRTATNVSRTQSGTAGTLFVNDFLVDSASASADLTNGTVRARVFTGGHSPRRFSRANASLEEILTFSGPSGGPVLMTAGFTLTFVTDTLTVETGGPIGGSATSDIRGSFGIVDLQPSGFSTLYRANLSSVTQHHFTPAAGSPSVIGDVRLTGPSNVVSIPNSPSSSSRISEIRAEWQRLNVSNATGRVEIDFLVRPGDRFQFQSSILVEAAAPPGHAALADGSNTGVIDLSMPEGWSFTSESGVFLTEPAVAPVPLPATGLLLLGGIAAFAVARAKRRPTPISA